jgi:hypothetical protein
LSETATIGVFLSNYVGLEPHNFGTQIKRRLFQNFIVIGKSVNYILPGYHSG